jgi:nitrile hydratase subunit beta
MNGIHDMGGMHGFGPVAREVSEPVFHEPWEGRVFGMRARYTSLFRPRYPGVNRGYIESIAPLKYLGMSYYERFLDSLVRRAFDDGVITEAELEARMRRFADAPSSPVPQRMDPESVSAVGRMLTTQLQAASEGRPPRFAVGDEVRAINVSRAGHNRLPRYVRGRQGVVERVNGLHRIEDELVFGQDQTPQTVYTVRFSGREVWGPESEPNVFVYLELWEDYLEAA